MATPKHFLIAGATGRQGGAVVTALLTQPDFKIPPQNIWAITRNAAGPSAQHLISKCPGINIVSGDLNNPDALFKQLGNILPQTAAFLAQAHGPIELSDAKGFIDAVASHGVAYLVYSSTFSDKFYIEQHLKSVAKNAGMGYTILRPTWLADNADWGFPGKLCMTGWKVWMRGKKMQVVTLSDLGRWAAEALIRPERTGIRDEALSVASEELSFGEFDEIWTRKTGEGVPVTVGWFAVLVIWLVRDLNTMFRFIDERNYGADLGWLKERVELTSVAQWVDSINL
ncbi:NAD(P)-binding protein [Hyaloscypha variabilis]